MNRIWANRLEAGDQVWSSVPTSRKAGVKAILKADVVAGVITAEQYETITGEAYTA